MIVRTVNKGEKVNITGFGVFEKRARAARTARNPRTGETVKVKKTNVPAFRAGTTFKDVVSGAKKLPKVATTRSAASRTASTTRAAAATTRTAAARPASRAAATTTRTRAAAAKPAARTTAAKATAAKAPAKATTAKKAAPAKAAAKKATPAKATQGDDRQGSPGCQAGRQEDGGEEEVVQSEAEGHRPDPGGGLRVLVRTLRTKTPVRWDFGGREELGGRPVGRGFRRPSAGREPVFVAGRGSGPGRRPVAPGRSGAAVPTCSFSSVPRPAGV